MAAVAAELRQRGCPVEKVALPAPLRMPRATPATRAAAPDSHWAYLTHYTREPDGRWPGEALPEFLRWLSTEERVPQRSAFETLCRILREQRLRACGRLIPRFTPMVCFTPLPPEQVRPLRIWRTGLARWSFTPVGLAIRRAALESVSPRPVAYVSPERLAAAPPEEAAFMQLTRSGSYDWSREQEWRVAGDVPLTAIAPECLLALVTTAGEQAYIEREFGIRAIVNV